MIQTQPAWLKTLPWRAKFALSISDKSSRNVGVRGASWGTLGPLLGLRLCPLPYAWRSLNKPENLTEAWRSESQERIRIFACLSCSSEGGWDWGPL